MVNEIVWTDETWNPTSGCDRVSPGCDNCLSPDTRVLMADMTWVPIKDVMVGDKVVSFTETPALGCNRVWEEAVVEATWETVKPAVELTLANGVVIVASEEHKWLVANRGKDAWWRETITLNFKMSVRALRCEPTNSEHVDYMAGYVAGATDGDGTFRWDPSWRSSSMGFPQSYWRIAKPVDDIIVLERLVDYLHRLGVEVNVRPFDSGPGGFSCVSPKLMTKVETRKLSDLQVIAEMQQEAGSREWIAGWLAGLFDTDASYCGGSLRFCQAKDNDVLDRACRYAAALGFIVAREQYNSCPTARLMGGIAENIAFLAAIHPALTRRCRDFYGKRVDAPAAAVTGLRRIGDRHLIDITTSTGTFVAEGALTHNCYAMGMAKRLKAMGSAGYQNDGDPRTSGPGFALTLHPERLGLPLTWRKPRKVFVNSMSDLFHKDVPEEFIARVFGVMVIAPQHTFQLLTKRHARMRALLGNDRFRLKVINAAYEMAADRYGPVPDVNEAWPIPNLWLGVSVEDQHWADIRIPALLDAPAAVRWISAEPLLGPIDLLRSINVEPLAAYQFQPGGLDWVVVGGESGPKARPMHRDWARSLRGQCAASGVPFLFKQHGSWVSPGQMPDDTFQRWESAHHGEDQTAPVRVGKKAAGRELDGVTHDGYPSELVS